MPVPVTGRTTLTSGWKVELGIGDPEAIADVGVYDTSRYPDLSSESFFQFPGTAGSYLSTPDLNLLDADTAHSVQAPWANQYQATNIQLVAEPTSIFGDSVTQWQSNGAGQIRPVTNSFAISASTQYTIAYRVRQVGGANPAFRMHLEEYDSGGTRIGLPFYTTDTDLTDGEWQWTYVTHTFDPAAVTLRMYSSFNSVTSGDVYQLDAASLAFGAVVPDDTSFIPSLRIVGNLDMEVKAAAKWATNASETLIGRAKNTSSRTFFLDRVVNSRFALSTSVDGSSSTAVATDILSLADDDIATVRATISDLTRLYLNGSLEKDGAAPSSLFVSDSPLEIGSLFLGTVQLFAGDIYYAEVRDGIDGPVVARFDPANYTGPDGSIPDGTTWQGPTGRTWTTHGTLESVKTEPDTKPIYGSNDPFGYLVDVTSRVEGLSTTRGRERFTSRFRTGTASISVLNTDGAFTPPSGGGPIGILPLRPGRAVKITNNGADVFAGFIDSFTGYQGYDGKVSTSILCVDQFGQFTRNDLPGVTAEGAGDTVVARMRRLLDRHIDDYRFTMMGTPEATLQATEMAQDLMSELALTADSEGGGVFIGKSGDIVALGRDYFQDIAEAGLVKWSVGGTNPITIQGYTDEWAAIRILNESHYARAGGTEQIRTNDESISKFGRRTHTRLDLICDDDVYVGELAERLVQFAGVDRLRITGLTFLPEVGSDAAAMAVQADFGDLILVTITTITGIEWTAPVQVFGVQHTVSDEVWETVLLTDDTLFTGEFYAFNQLAFDSLAFS